MNIVPLASHPSNPDKTARIVAEDRGGDWTIYGVRGGFVLTIWGSRAVEDLFPSEREARDAIATALEICPPGDGSPIKFRSATG